MLKLDNSIFLLNFKLLIIVQFATSSFPVKNIEDRKSKVCMTTQKFGRRLHDWEVSPDYKIIAILFLKCTYQVATCMWHCSKYSKTELRKLCHAFWMKKFKIKSYHLGIGLLTPKVGCGHHSGEVQVLAKVDEACATSYNWTPWAEFAESLSNPSGRKMAADEFQINWKNHIIFCLFYLFFFYISWQRI